MKIYDEQCPWPYHQPYGMVPAPKVKKVSRKRRKSRALPEWLKQQRKLERRKVDTSDIPETSEEWFKKAKLKLLRTQAAHNPQGVTMDLQLVNLPERKVTLRERCIRAYYAFRMELTPDLQQLLDELRAFREQQDVATSRSEHQLEQAMSKLEPYDKAIIESIAGATQNWRELFDTAMIAIVKLETADQITIMRHMFAGNRRIVADVAFRQWMTRNSEALLDSLPE